MPESIPNNAIVPYNDQSNSQVNAVWLDGDTEIESITKPLDHLDLIAIHIPGFADGRALTLATLLRQRYQFKGEIRAIGEVLPDWTPFMYRCGFDAFELADEESAKTAIQCMQSITEFYQASAIDAKPAFRKIERS